MGSLLGTSNTQAVKFWQDAFDAELALAGEKIAEKRWSTATKIAWKMLRCRDLLQSLGAWDNVRQVAISAVMQAIIIGHGVKVSGVWNDIYNEFMDDFREPSSVKTWIEVMQARLADLEEAPVAKQPTYGEWIAGLKKQIAYEYTNRTIRVYVTADGDRYKSPVLARIVGTDIDRYIDARDEHVLKPTHEALGLFHVVSVFPGEFGRDRVTVLAFTYRADGTKTLTGDWVGHIGILNGLR